MLESLVESTQHTGASPKGHGMRTVEFQTYIDQDMIQLPDELQGRVMGQARVIIVTDEPESDDDLVDFLLDHPLTIGTFTPLTRDELYERR